MFDVIDKIFSLDLGDRGVGHLYEPTRAGNKDALCLIAARLFMDLKAGEHVFLLTGSLTRNWVSKRIAETDGPIGTAVLARTLSYGFNAIPVVLIDELVQDKMVTMLQIAGLSVVDEEEAKAATSHIRPTRVAMVRTCSTLDAVARDECRSLVAFMVPKVVVAIERAGMTADGTYRNSLAQDFSDGRSRLDYIVSEASDRGIPTIGIGDGGNEIGMGNVPDAVARFIPLGDKICPVQKTDLLLPCGVSNWGAYAIAAAIALLKGNPELAHQPELEERLINACPAIGFVEGFSGRLEPAVDAFPAAVHIAVVELMLAAVKQGIVGVPVSKRTSW
jgi:hypothetical protein